LTFTRTTLMPQFLPQGPPAAPNGPPQQPPLAKKLQAWVKGVIQSYLRHGNRLTSYATANYDGAMRIVAFTEIVILIRVILGALILQNSFLTPLIFAHFLRMRYFQSQFTKDSVHRVTYVIDGYVNRPGMPPVAVQGWQTFQMVVGRWTGARLPAPADPAGARQ
jgi:transmembrane protein 33